MAIFINGEIRPTRAGSTVARLNEIDLDGLTEAQQEIITNYARTGHIEELSEAEQTLLDAINSSTDVNHTITQESTLGNAVVTILDSEGADTISASDVTTGATASADASNTRFQIQLSGLQAGEIYRVRVDYYDTLNQGGTVGRSVTYYSNTDFLYGADGGGVLRLGAANDSATILNALNRSVRITIDRINRDSVTITFGTNVIVNFAENSTNFQRIEQIVAAYNAANPPASGGEGGTPLTAAQTTKLSLLLLENIQHAINTARVFTTTDNTETEVTDTNGVFTLPATFDSIRVLVPDTADISTTTVAVTTGGTITRNILSRNIQGVVLQDGHRYYQIRSNIIPAGSTSLEIDIPAQALALSNVVSHNTEQITDLRNSTEELNQRVANLASNVASGRTVTDAQEKILQILANQYVRDRYTAQELFAGMTTLFAIYNNGSGGIANPVDDAPSVEGWTLESGLLDTSHFDHNGGVLKSNENGLNIGDELANDGDSILVAFQFERINTRSNADDTKLLTLGTSDEDGNLGLHLQDNRLFWVSNPARSTAERTIRSYHSLGELIFQSPDTLPLTLAQQFRNNSGLAVEFTARLIRTGESPSLPVSFIQRIDTTQNSALDNFHPLYFGENQGSYSLDFSYDSTSSELSITLNGAELNEGESIQIRIGTVVETTATATTGYATTTDVNTSYITAQPMFVAVQLIRTGDNLRATISANGSRPVRSIPFELEGSTDRVLYFGQHVAFRSIYGAFINTSPNEFLNSLDQFTTNYVGNNTDPRTAFTHQVNHPQSLRIGRTLPRNVHIGHGDLSDDGESGVISGQSVIITPALSIQFISLKFNDALPEAVIPNDVNYTSANGTIILPVDNEEEETHWYVVASVNIRPMVSNPTNAVDNSDRQVYTLSIYQGTGFNNIRTSYPTGALELYAQSLYLKNFNFGTQTTHNIYRNIQGKTTIGGYVKATPGQNSIFIGIAVAAQSGIDPNEGVEIIGAQVRIFEISNAQQRRLMTT